MLFSLGGSFLYYADRFKLYSAFCASHTKVPKVLVKGRRVRTGWRVGVSGVIHTAMAGSARGVWTEIQESCQIVPQIRY